MNKYYFTEQEVKALKVFIDAGVKMLGVSVAEAAVLLIRRLDNPLKEEDEKPKDDNNLKR